MKGNIGGIITCAERLHSASYYTDYIHLVLDQLLFQVAPHLGIQTPPSPRTLETHPFVKYAFIRQ